MHSIMRAGGSITALVLAALLVGLVPPAQAFTPAAQNQTYEIPLPEFDLEGHQSSARTAGSIAAAGTLSARYGGSWQVYSWNPQAATPRWIYGQSAKVADAIHDAADAERLARQVIAANTDVLRADANQLRLIDAPNALGKWAVHFQQTWHGLDVWGATVRVLFAEDGRLMLMGSDYRSEIALSPVPVLSQGQAIDIARASVPFNPSTDRVEEGTTLLVLPYSLSASEVEYHLVWRVRVRTEDPIGIWVTHVDAQNGRILWRYNDVHFAYSGTTSAPVQYFGYCDGITQMTIPYLRINVTGVGTVTSDSQGDWSIDGTGGPRTVTSDLYGPYVDMNNAGGAEAAFSGTAQENVPLTVTFNDTNAQHDERDTFDAVNDIHDFFEIFAPGFSYTNARINANVSINSSCNAYWDGTINFYQQGGGCANTGEMQQVVHHEYGHGVQDRLIGGQGGQGLGEGNADILGNLMTQDPIIGRGFYFNNCTSGIRNSLNTLQYPGDVIGQEIHFAGQVIAGFNWDAMVLLQQQYGTATGTIMSASRWHYGRQLMRPQTQPDQVLATFIADDDNGDLDDGTPNHAIFCEAAQNHGFTCPEILVGVFLYHDAHPYSGDQALGYVITGTALSLPPGQGNILPNSVMAHYRVNGGNFSDIGMSATGNPDEYTATIPAQGWGSVVEYYLSASDDLGANGTSPRDAPATLHYFQVNDDFPDAMETATAWTSGAADDNAGTGRWERVDPIGTVYNGQPVQPEDDHTADPAHICWITGNGTVGGAPGDADVDGGKTTLLSPRFDLNNATQVQVSYWKYFTNDRGNNPGQDYWSVDVTNDGGQTWIPIEHTLTATNAWADVAFDLDQYIPEPDLDVAQFRFVADDEAPGSLIEAGVDDFLLTAIFNTEDADDSFGVRLVTGLEQNSPNPFGPVTDIRFRLAQPETVTLAVYDGAGRRVASLAQGPMTPGEHHVQWNGTDDAGHPIAAGTYFYRLEAGGRTFSARMVLVR